MWVQAGVVQDIQVCNLSVPLIDREMLLGTFEAVRRGGGRHSITADAYG